MKTETMTNLEKIIATAAGIPGCYHVKIRHSGGVVNVTHFRNIDPFTCPGLDDGNGQLSWPEAVSATSGNVRVDYLSYPFVETLRRGFCLLED